MCKSLEYRTRRDGNFLCRNRPSAFAVLYKLYNHCYVAKRQGVVVMDKFQIVFVLVFFVALVFSHIAKRCFPEKVNKIIPYNFVVLGSIFCYLSKAHNNANTFTFYAGVGFFVYGIFLLLKRRLHNEA